MGDRCKSCDDRFTQLGYNAYMSFEAFIEHEQTEAGKNEVSAASSSKEDPAARNFSLDSVDTEVEIGYKVSRNYLVMNEGEFVATFGAKPHSKMPSAPCMQIRKDNSSVTEKVWLFAHPLLKHRTLELFSLHGVSKSTSVLDSAAHYHEAQGAKVFNYTADAAAQDSKAKLLSASMRIPDIDNYSAAFQKQRDEASAKRHKHNKGRDDLEEGEEFLEEGLLDFADGDGGGEFGQAEVGMSQESEALDDSAEALAQMLQDSTEATAVERRPKEASFVSPSFKRARTQSVFNDGASAKSGTQASDGGMESSLKKAKRHAPEYYINELPLDKVVEGEKLGVPEHHARLLLGGAAGIELEPDMIALHNHLDLVDAAKKLAPGEVQNLLPTALHKHLTDIILHQQVAAPPKLQAFLLERHWKDLIPLAVDIAGMKKLIGTLRPWGGPESGASFDVFEPRLHAAEMTPVEKAKLFASRLTSSVIIPLLLKCPEGCALLHSTCDYLLEVLNEVNLCEVVDTFLQCALEMGEVIKPLWALSSMDLEVQEAQIDDLSYLYKHMGKAGANLVCVIGPALRRASWLSARLEKLMEKHAVLGEVAADMKEHKHQLKEGGDIDIAIRVASVGASGMPVFDEVAGELREGLLPEVREGGGGVGSPSGSGHHWSLGGRRKPRCRLHYSRCGCSRIQFRLPGGRRHHTTGGEDREQLDEEPRSRLSGGIGEELFGACGCDGARWCRGVALGHRACRSQPMRRGDFLQGLRPVAGHHSEGIRGLRCSRMESGL